MTDLAIDLGGLSPVFLPIVVPVGAGTPHLATGRCLVSGWNVINPGAAAERIDFYDGADATGTRIGGAIVPLSDTRDRTFTAPGAYCQAGVTAVVTGADLVAVVYIAYLDE